ncbi:MAG TPA: ABC transporter permease [Micromonosporaceae bacterium]
MVAYIVRRLIMGVFLLVVVSMITFTIFFLVPRLGGATPDSLASRYVGNKATPEQVHTAAVKLGFYDPVPVQYGRWAKAIIVGADYDYGPGVEHCPAPCFGYSFQKSSPVWPDLLDRARVTFSLAIGAAVIWVFFGVSTGIISALRRGSFFDRASMSVALAGVSLPIFFTGLIALVTFSYGHPFRITAPGGTYDDFTKNPALWAYDLILPWITLAFLFAAAYARLTRAGMLETMNEDFVRTARAKGLAERTVVVKHGLRAAITPIVTIFGLDLGLLLGGAVLTETTFGLPGLGKYAVDAVSNQDLPQVMGVTMFSSSFIVLANIVVDLFYAVVDPRVRVA